MNAVRFVLVFLFYVAAELMSPVAVTALEVLDGEVEESLHHAGQRRLARIRATQDRSESDRRHAVLRPSRAVPMSAPARAWARSDTPRKIPAPVPESASAPEDH